MITQRTQLIMLVLVTIAIAIPLTGCSTTGFKKPDFSKLAFWKGGGDAPLPPPPARHFTPADFDGEGEVQVADVNQFGEKPSTAVSELRDRLEISRSDFNKPLDPKADSMVADAGNSDQNSNNMFDLNLSKIESAVDRKAAASQNTLASAQEDFKSAMAATVDSGKQAANDSLYNLKQPMYDAKGRLIDQSKSMLADGKDSLKINADALKNQFDSAAAAAKDFADSSKLSAQSRIADASRSATEMINQPFPKFGQSGLSKPESITSNDPGIRNLQAEIAAQKRQIEQLRLQAEAAKTAKSKGVVADGALAPMQPKSSPLSPMSTSGGFAASSQPSSAGSNQAFTPQSALKKATGPLSQLATAGDSGSGSDAGFSPGGALSRLAPIPSSEGGSTAGIATAPVSPSSKSSTVYGSLSPEPSSSNQFSPSGNNAAPKPGNSVKPAENQFPATPYNGFSGGGFSTQKSTQIQPVGFDSESNQANPVVSAGALVPIGKSRDPVGGVGRIGSFTPDENVSAVNGVEIPAAILTGDGSYAPGSVNRLRR